MWLAASIMLMATGSPAGANAQEGPGAADFAKPLTDAPGEAARGRDIVFARDRGNCIVCHAFPAPGNPMQGTIGPPLAGVGGKRSEAELRMRLVDSRLLNPKTLMPPYHSTAGLTRVGKAYDGRPVLTAQEIEDVVAYLKTLQE